MITIAVLDDSESDRSQLGAALEEELKRRGEKYGVFLYEKPFSLLADLESFQLAVSRTQDAELEAMFLAGLDCGLMLSCGLQPFPRLAQK